MTSQNRRNELGDELEVKLMKNKVLPSIIPKGIDFKHIPKTIGGPDFLIIRDGKVEIVIECKNWDNEVPSDGQVQTEILERFKNYKSDELKILVGHVNFTDEQKERFLLKNEIWYDDLQSQIKPEDGELKKHEFEEKLRSSVASVLLFHIDKFRDDCIGDMRVNIIGNNEISFELNGKKWPVNLKNRDSIWFRRFGSLFSTFRKVGPNALDLIITIRGGSELHEQNFLLIPRKYKVYSNTVQFESEDGFLTTQEDVGLSLGTFFKWVKWENTM